jgi:hypothetical protein
MGFRIRVARTTSELDDLFRLRHRVFVDEEGYLRPRQDGRIADRFDAYPTTANLVALVDDLVVGTVRVALLSEAGSPPEELFDFAPHLPEGALPRACSGSMICVERAYRDTPRLVFALLGMAYFWARSQGRTTMLGAVNPDREAFFARAGGTKLGPTVAGPDPGLGAVPILIDLESLPAELAAFVDRQRVVSYADSFEREFLERGEIQIWRRDAESTGRIVVDGGVAVARPGARGIVELGRGELIAPPGHVPIEVSALSPAELMVLTPRGPR